jgi:ABC-2 type transport system permease protein
VGRGGLGLVIRRELHRVTRRRLYPLLLVVLPLAGWFTLGSTFASRTPRELPIVVRDDDGSALSRHISRSLDASPTLRVVADESGHARTGSVLRDGSAYAVVLIPAGLERAAARRETMPVTLVYNAQWQLPGNLIARDVRATLAALSREVEVERATGSGMATRQAATWAEPITTELHALFNPSLDYAAFLFLALVPTLFHMFVLLITVEVTGRELKHATARSWLRTAGRSVPVALVGKLLPYAAWFIVAGSLLLEASLAWTGVRVAGSRLLLHGASVLMVLAYQSLGLLLVALTANLRLATTAVGLIAAPSFAVVGMSFPLLAMPLAARAWAAALPLTHFLDVQTSAVMIGGPLSASALSLLALAAFVCAGWCVALPRFAVLLREPRYWRHA